MAWYGGGHEFADYLSVAERRARARKAAEKIARKRGSALVPVGPIEGNKLVRTFWGKAWCENLESYSGYVNRLPRGRSYARHGAVIDLQIANGKVSALVSGTSTYEITVTIRSLHPRRWKEIAAASTGKIDSLVDLLSGKLSKQVMEIVTHKERGLFPSPDQISFACSCPDWADMCKHIAAVLYGVGVRFDEKPDLLFALRGVDHADLISGAADDIPHLIARGSTGRKVIKSADLSALFGIELEAPAVRSSSPPRSPNGAGDRGLAAPPRSRSGKGKSGKGAKSPPAGEAPSAVFSGTIGAHGKAVIRKRR
jgi:SWIM zinc finger